MNIDASSRMWVNIVISLLKNKVLMKTAVIFFLFFLLKAFISLILLWGVWLKLWAAAILKVSAHTQAQ